MMITCHCLAFLFAFVDQTVASSQIQHPGDFRGERHSQNLYFLRIVGLQTSLNLDNAKKNPTNGLEYSVPMCEKYVR